MEFKRRNSTRSKSFVSKDGKSSSANKQPLIKAKEKVPQILDVLREIQGQCKSSLSLKNSRKCTKLIRSMVINESYTYSPVVDFATVPSIHYDQNVIYLGNFALAFRVGCYSVARLLHFKPAPFRHNVVEYLYVQAPIDKSCDQCSKLQCCQPGVLALSTKNALNKLIVIHFGATSGYIRHFVLDADRSFGSAKMQWNVAYESFSVSINLKDVGIFKSFMFSVFPISYKGCVSTKKNLGEGTTGLLKDVCVTLDMLVMHQGRDMVRIYNVHGSMLTLDSHPVHIDRFQDLATPLLVVNKCAQFSMQIGGFPFRLLTERIDGGHDVRTLEGERIGFLGPIDANCIMDDTVMFAETESGHVIQRGEHSISMFKLPEEKCTPKQLIPIHPPVHFNFHPPVERPCKSAYGRTLVRTNYDEGGWSKPSTIRCDLDLEDELDLLYTITCDYLAQPPQLYINVLDSQTLQLLKTTPLDFPTPKNYNGDYETVFHMDVSADRDLLIVRWLLHGKSHLILYQLHHKNATSLPFINSISGVDLN